ncbi:MAG: CCA tRNA nucleotidyltransferase [Candidatus Thermoplasmatota archaeon]
MVRFRGRDVDIRTPHNVSRITDTINARGRGYIVGGFVRDALMGRPSKDIDIEVHGMEINEIRDALTDSGFKVDEVGKSFGVLKVKDPLTRETVDVSVPRRDSTGRKPDVQFIRDATPETAAARRDFTMNAIMYDTKDDQIVDPYNGLQDLERGIIRAVTPDSFADDPLRVVRAAQFSARFGFKIDPDTAEMASTADVRAMAPERTKDEMLKVLEKSDKPSLFFESMDEMGHLETMFPEIHALKGVEQDPEHHPEGDAYRHTLDVMDRVSKTGKPTLVLAAALHDTGKAKTTQVNPKTGRIQSLGHADESARIAEQFMERYKFPAKETKDVTVVVKHHMRPHHMVNENATRLKHKHRVLFDVAGSPKSVMDHPEQSIEKYRDVVEFAKHDANRKQEEYDSLKELPPLEHYTPTTRGADLLKEGLKGPELGKRLTELYVNQVNHMQEKREKRKKIDIPDTSETSDSTHEPPTTSQP